MKTCVKSDGTYLGTYHSEPPKGLIVVPYEPSDARQVWIFDAQEWGAIPESHPDDLTLGEVENIVAMFPVSYGYVLKMLGFGDVV